MTSGSTQGPPTSSNRGFMLAVLGLVVVGLAIVAVVATRTGDDGGEVAEEQTAAVDVEGATLDVLPEGVQIGSGSTDPVVGQLAPTLQATDFEGNVVTIGADGRPKAIYFLAHWCPHCQDEVPVIQQLIDDGAKPDALDVYAVSTAVDAGRGNYPPQSWLDGEGFEPVVVRDDDTAAAFAGFGGSAFPYVVYLDGDHRVVARAAGNVGAEATTELWELTAATVG